MNYHNLTYPDLLNGEGLRVVLWLSGCNHKCDGCQNPQTWNPNGGIKFDKEAQDELFRELSKDYISGLTLSGGDPLHENNLDDVLALLKQIRILFGNSKTIWLYSGYTWEDIWDYGFFSSDIYNRPYGAWTMLQLQWQEVLKLCDVFVDGQFEKDKADMSLKFRGSSNQRIWINNNGSWSIKE